MSRNKTYTISKPNPVDSVQRGSAIDEVAWKTICAGAASPPLVFGCPLTVHIPMGQEDLFREDPVGTRVQNFLTGRIVVATSVDALVTIDYSPDDTSLSLTTGVYNPGDAKMYHEIFITGLIPDALYAFRVTATSTVCPAGENGPVQSGIYYFVTGNEVAVLGDNWSYVINTSLLTIGATISESYDGLGALIGDTEEETADGFGYSTTAAVEDVDKSLSQTAGDTMLYTGYSTVVT